MRWASVVTLDGSPKTEHACRRLTNGVTSRIRRFRVLTLVNPRKQTPTRARARVRPASIENCSLEARPRPGSYVGMAPSMRV